MLLDTAKRPRLVISLTPLIDVVFILLLFFMLTTQFGREQAIALEAPVSSSSSSTSDDDAIMLRLLADGTIDAGTEPPIEQSDLDQIPMLMEALEADAKVRVRADDDVDLQAFTGFMDQLSAMGFVSISVQGLR